MNESVHWNGRYWTIPGADFPTVCPLFAQHEVPRSLYDRQGYIKPTMARPPDESEAGIEVGYDERRGVFVEGKWTWSWKDKDGKETDPNTNERTQASDPPDSRDRDFDKD